MLAAGLLENEPRATEERVREVLSSNLCRCTGYTPIVAAVLAAQRELTS
jgi:aerobic-type carbon monoxide dehydrogenase small subunit (CoxS/CutS family)